MHRTRSLFLALSLASGLAAPASAGTFVCLVDGNGLKMGGSATSFFGVPFRAVRDDVARTVTFYIKGDVRFDAGTTVQLQVTGSPYPVRVVFGNDAEFPGGLNVFAGTAGAGGAGLPGTGGASTPGRKGDGYFHSAWGGWGGKSHSCLYISNGGDGHNGSPNSGAEDALPGTSGNPGSNGGLGINQNSQLGGFGTGGGAGSPAPITSRVEMVDYPSGGQGGNGGIFSGTNGADGEAGRAGPDQNPSASGGQGGDAALARNPLNLSLYPILISGNGGGSGAGGGGGAPGNGGEGGSSGGAGGGGGSTNCEDGGDGGDGGTGGGGQPGGNGGAGGNGNYGGAGGGAIEITALGRLTISSGNFDAQGQSAAASRIAGLPGTAGLGGYNGGAGSPGQHVNSPAGDGGAGGRGGHGGVSGNGGNGGAGGLGTGGSGGTIFFSATELNVSGTYKVSGGTNGLGLGRSDSGRAIVSYSHMKTGTISANLAQDNGPLLTLPGMVPEAQGASPFINGGTTVPYIAGLSGGAAIAGVIPNVTASSIVNPATLPPNTVAGLLMLDTDVPGITYDKTKYRALLYLNYNASSQFQTFSMGIGGYQFAAGLRTYGWANDARFVDGGHPWGITVLGDAVYVTLVPIGQLNQNLARVGGTFINLLNGGTDSLNGDSLTFGVGVGKMLTIQRSVCTGDLNGDCVVDDADFSIFVVAYDILECGASEMAPGCPADLNHDGFVDDADFSLFVVAYDALVCP
ncbi:MAG: hypothetical protein U0573_04495 [Phycisphaerales bacterium]|nr:hypothetical protein [Planctomycetota bacterium]